MTINPYASPFEEGLVELPSRIRVDGPCIVVPSGAVLPGRCIKTNEPIREEDTRTKTYDWCHPAIFLLIFCNLLILLIVYLIVRKRCKITFGMVPEIRARYRNWVLVKCLITGALFAGMFVPMAMGPIEGSGFEWIFVLLLFSFFISLIVLLIGNSPLRPVKFRDGLFWIKGCSPEFLLSLEQK